MAPSDGSYRTLFESSPLAAVVYARDDRRILLANRAAEALYRYAEGELVGRVFDELRAPPDVSEVLTKLSPASPAGISHHRTKDGVAISVEVHASDATFEGRDVTLCLVHDASERERLAIALHATEERSRQLFESLPLATFVVQQGSGRFVEVNEAAVRLYGYTPEEFAARTIFDLRANADGPKRDALDKDPAHGGIWKHLKKSGQAMEVELSVYPIVLGDEALLLVLADDITMRKQLEEQLLQSQKMEAVGRLAGGIAHDFNNVLSAVLVGSECVMTDLGEQHALYEDVAHIRAAAMRGASLTHQLLAFSRRQILQPKVLELNGVVVDLEKMLRRLIGEDVKLTIQLDPSLGLVHADQGQITQVLMNLVVNARDAMPGGGSLVISTRNDELDERTAPLVGDLRPGAYVVLSVRDTGHGMDEATLAKIFDPFFTTKEHGKGTGLGLSTVFGVVRQSAGGIRVLSKPGQGATFEVYFPRIDESRPRSVTTPRGARLLRGTETVLLVEDDMNVRAMVGRTLKAHGYRVLEAASGEAAVAVCDAATQKIQLVLSDVVMPGLDGPATVAAIRKRIPDVRVLYMSGYSEHPALHAGATEAQLLRKPFSVEELISGIRGALDARA
jgi:hypothetical protein